MQAVLLVRSGWSTRQAARHMGFAQSTIVKWCKRAPNDRRPLIPTKSSRPKSHPRAITAELRQAIIAQRQKNNRCTEVVHQELKNKGILVSHSTIKRTLRRAGLLKERSPWKRTHDSTPRPIAQKPGDLVQMDTIHIVPWAGSRFYIYTLIDLHSRWAYAKVVPKINTHATLDFLKEAQKHASFDFRVVQTDHGSEFSTYFTEHAQKRKIVHRHSRVRQSNDNAHIERFNRTVQEECFDKHFPSIPAFRKALKPYLSYYNNDRLHLSLNLLTPAQVIPSY